MHILSQASITVSAGVTITLGLRVNITIYGTLIMIGAVDVPCLLQGTARVCTSRALRSLLLLALAGSSVLRAPGRQLAEPGSMNRRSQTTPANLTWDC